MADEKILLVDDDNDFTEVMTERMESRGLKVDTAKNGSIAVDKVKDKSYDAIVLDLSMPGIDGIETLKMLLERQPDLQVILLTGHATVEKGVEAVKLGAMDFLEKPANLEKLIKKIQEAKHKKMLIVENKVEEKITKIIREKGW
ncbi:MAG: response regulator [candidate division Zixibacteria bacterium]|nr:response regulator [candidate division Zixibacteria bacterium]